MTRLVLAFGLGLTLIAAISLQSAAETAAPSGPTTGLLPLNDLKTGLYLGTYTGGLYPNGSNDMPPAHVLVGLDRAGRIQPLDADGNPSPAGKYVLLSVGMSNTTQEFWAANPRGPATPWSFAGQTTVNPVANHSTMVIVDGAKGGQTPNYWSSSTSPNYDRVRDEQLAPLNLTEKQVQAISGSRRPTPPPPPPCPMPTPMPSRSNGAWAAWCGPASPATPTSRSSSSPAASTPATPPRN
jgi:hypothetical protein